MAGLTIGQYWDWLCQDHAPRTAPRWAPDIAALTNALLERSHAFRFVVSPPPGCDWPPQGDHPFDQRVRAAARQWRAAMDRGGPPPDDVRDLWAVIQQHLDAPVGGLAHGEPWVLCEAILALHAIADETCAPTSGPVGAVFLAQARERLARTGSMATLPVDRIAFLPKARTTSVGITHRSLSRYGSTSVDGVRVVWDRVPVSRRAGQEKRHANVVLLPWPLRIRENDFVPVPGSVRRPEREPFGFFTYQPSEPLDLGLVDALLTAAREEVDDVDAVILPEACLDDEQIIALERLLAARNVPMLITGHRPPVEDTGRFAGNRVHIGVLTAGMWSHYRQNKHHRWFLDGTQIETYNIAGALHPGVRWWEAMEIPERRVHLLDLGGGLTVCAVVCEDLARLDGVAQLLRSTAPTLVLTLLLDGPQLGFRWTSRYAGVLADDPGSSVLTLTALGMAIRSQPNGAPPSRVVALWKDPRRGMREIAVEPGAQAVLLTTVLDSTARYAADGRLPSDDATDIYVAGVHQLRASSGPAPELPAVPVADVNPHDLSVVSAWAQAVVDGGPEAARAARAGAPWRRAAGLAEPEGILAAALDFLGGQPARREASDAARLALLAARESVQPPV